MSEYLIQEKSLTDIADAIREKAGNTEKMTPAEMAEAITAIPVGGGDDALKALIDRTIAECTVPSDVTVIGPYAFFDCYELGRVELPEGLKRIGESAFQNCLWLEIQNLPSGITEIDSAAFFQCSRSLNIDALPSELESIGTDAFYRCYKISISRIPQKVRSIGDRAFGQCGGLTNITFEGTPKSIGNYAFSECDSIVTINVPWQEGEVNVAPWGATNATINYNYTGG